MVCSLVPRRSQMPGFEAIWCVALCSAGLADNVLGWLCICTGYVLIYKSVLSCYGNSGCLPLFVNDINEANPARMMKVYALMLPASSSC